MLSFSFYFKHFLLQFFFNSLLKCDPLILFVMQYIIYKHNTSNMYCYNLGEDCSSSSTVSCFVFVHILNQLLDINKITRRWQLFRGTACVHVLSQSQSQSQRFQISLLLLQLWSLLSSLTVEERIITEAAHIVGSIWNPLSFEFHRCSSCVVRCSSCAIQ